MNGSENNNMPVFSMRKEYKTKKHMGMLDVTSDFQEAISKSKLKDGIITGFTTGGVAALTVIEWEPGIVNHDLKAALDIISPFKDERGIIIPYEHHKTWGDTNGSSHIKSAILGPFITAPFIDGKLIHGPWQSFALVECNTDNDRVREIIYQVIGE